MSHLLFQGSNEILECLDDGRDFHAWYDGDSIDLINNIWIDKTGNNHTGIINITTGMDVFDGTDITNTELYLNGQSIITGTNETQIIFNVELNPKNHTVFNLAKHRANTSARWKQRILQTNNERGAFGFAYTASGFAEERQWFAYNIWWDVDFWVLSSQQRDLYRANNMEAVYYFTLEGPGFETVNKLMINTGFDSDEIGSFAIAELIVINDKIDLTEIKCIEDYFTNKYLLPSLSPTTTPTNSPSNAASYSPTASPSLVCFYCFRSET